MINATVSGSFHRHMPAIYEAVGDLRAAGVNVLSPSDPRVVDAMGEFLFVASDRLRSVKLVQDRHLEAIRASDFLWVVCPDGYTGPSTSGEILAASVMRVPVFSISPALDVTIGQYVRKVPSIRAAIEEVIAANRQRAKSSHVLLDPDYAVAKSISTLERLGAILANRAVDDRGSAEHAFSATQQQLRETFNLR